MEWLVIAAVAFFAVLVFAPQGVVKVLLASSWLLLALAGVAALAHALLR